MAVREGKLFRLEIDGKEIQDEISYDFSSDSDEQTTTTKDGDYTTSTSSTKTVNVNVAFNTSAGTGANAASRALMADVFTLSENKNEVTFRMGGYQTNDVFWSGNVKVLSFQHSADATAEVVGYSFTAGVQGSLTIDTVV